MRRVLAATFVAMISATAVSGSVGADGTDHNCAGAVSSALAQSLGGDFGAAVSAAAQDQLVDNFGLRNCGAAPGNNP